MNTEQLIKYYQQGKRDFVWADLEGACLQGFQLSEANFNRAKFAEANLANADLCKSNFFKADLSHADLTGAKLEGTSFRKANLTGAKIELSAIPCTSLRGAILPDGKLMHLVHLEEPEVESPEGESPEADTASVIEGPDAENSITHPSSVEPSDVRASSEGELTPESEDHPSPSSQWAQGIAATGAAIAPETVNVSIPPEPEVPLPPPPKTWAEVWRALPQKPFSLLVFGYFLDGLTLHFCGAGGSAWIISAISILLWAVNDAWTWFIPIVIALTALYSGPVGFSNALYGFIVPGMVFIMLSGGLLVTGWHWRKALYGAFWVGSISAILLGLTPWLAMPVGQLAVIAPTALMGLMLVIAIGLICLGLTTRGAMIAVRMNRRQQMVVMAAGGVCGLVLGRGIGAFFG